MPAFPCAHWPEAQKELEQHVAHLKMAASVEPNSALKTAFDLMRTIYSLLSVTDAIGICWLNASILNGSVLNTALDFGVGERGWDLSMANPSSIRDSPTPKDATFPEWPSPRSKSFGQSLRNADANSAS